MLKLFLFYNSFYRYNLRCGFLINEQISKIILIFKVYLLKKKKITLLILSYL